MPNPSARLGEFDLIDRYFAPLARSSSGAENLTDDTASVSISAGHEAVLTMDTMVAGVHFFPDDPPADIARKLLRVNLSDLASACARPLTYFLAMSLPEETEESWIADFASGLEKDQEIFGVALSGGDTTVTPGPVTLSLTAMGETQTGKVTHRSTAQPGQNIYVSGTIGDAALALHLIESEGLAAALASAPSLVERYRTPEPRIAAGLRLRDLATAMIDISDGLIADLGHVCDTSNLAAELEFSRIPLSPVVAKMIDADPSLAERAVTGGDDYELLFTARPEDAGALSRLAADIGIPLTRIGQTKAGTGVTIRSPSGETMSVERSGWQHF